MHVNLGCPCFIVVDCHSRFLFYPSRTLTLTHALSLSLTRIHTLTHTHVHTQCLDVKNSILESHANGTLEVDTTFPLTIYLNVSETVSNGTISYHFAAKAGYEVTYNSSTYKWELHQTKKGENTYLREYTHVCNCRNDLLMYVHVRV